MDAFTIVCVCVVVLFFVFYFFVFKSNNGNNGNQNKRISKIKEYAESISSEFIKENISDYYDKYEFYDLPEVFAGFVCKDKEQQEIEYLYAESETSNLYAIKNSGISIPEFYFCIENYDDNMYMNMGFEDIDYEDDKEFSDTFYLRSPKREQIDRLFTAEVRKSSLDNFNKKGYKIFAKDDIIILTVTPKNTKLQSVDQFNNKLKNFLEVVKTRLNIMLAEDNTSNDRS